MSDDDIFFTDESKLFEYLKKYTFLSKKYRKSYRKIWLIQKMVLILQTERKTNLLKILLERKNVEFESKT